MCLNVCVCVVCPHYDIRSIKILILLTKWGRWGWSSKLQRQLKTVLRSKVGFRLRLGVSWDVTVRIRTWGT